MISTIVSKSLSAQKCVLLRKSDRMRVALSANNLALLLIKAEDRQASEQRWLAHKRKGAHGACCACSRVVSS